MATRARFRSILVGCLLAVLMGGAVAACSGGGGSIPPVVVPDREVEAGTVRVAEETTKQAEEEAAKPAEEETARWATEEAARRAEEEAARRAAEEAARRAEEETARRAAEEAAKRAEEEAARRAEEAAARRAAEDAAKRAADEAARRAAQEAARRAAEEEGRKRETAISDRALVRASSAPRGLVFHASYFAPDVAGGHWLRIPSPGHRFDGHYHIVDRVSDWSDSSNAIKWPSLVLEMLPSSTDLPHGMAVAYTKSTGDGVDLDYAAYGWWAILPTRWVTPRLIASSSGLSLGTRTPSADMPGADTEVTATWRGRATGVGVGGSSRWVLAGDVELNATLRGAKPGKVNGKITNTRAASVDTNLRDTGKAGNWYTVVLESTAVNGGAYSGNASVLSDLPEGFAGPRFPDSYAGWYTGMFYGSGAAETAGKGYLFESTLNYGSDNAVVFGFGARK